MGKCTELQQLSSEHFRRLTGIKRNTFEEAVRILLEEEGLRKYRTYFYLGRSYRLSESACYRICRWVEDTLIKPTFRRLLRKVKPDSDDFLNRLEGISRKSS